VFHSRDKSLSGLKNSETARRILSATSPLSRKRRHGVARCSGEGKNFSWVSNLQGTNTIFPNACKGDRFEKKGSLAQFTSFSSAMKLDLVNP